MRDYWRKPVQSDRTHHEYGHTKLSRDTLPLPLALRLFGGVGVLAILFVLVALICAGV